jgi:hypothetical protein
MKKTWWYDIKFYVKIIIERRINVEKPESRTFDYDFDPVNLNMSKVAILSTSGRTYRATKTEEFDTLVHEAVGISSILKLKYSIFKRFWACVSRNEQMVKEIINTDEINDRQQRENSLLLRMSSKHNHK